MASDSSQRPPALAAWGDVDPAQHPFDPLEARTALRKIAAALPQPEWREGRAVKTSEAGAWVEAVSIALASHYGPWAYRWYWGPGDPEKVVWIVDRIPASADLPTFVTDELVAWRRWLESLAERFDRLLPQLDLVQAAGPGDIIAAWEAAIANLMNSVDAWTVDGDSWQGWCRLTLQWFLTANGMSEQQAQALVAGAVDERFEPWRYLTTTDVADVSERLARDVLSTLGIVTVAPDEGWPDTWPQEWPVWRATNTGRAAR